MEEKNKKRTAYDARGAVTESQYHFVWPNLTININPGYPNLSLDVWMPDGPGRTRGFSEQYFGADVPEDFAREMMAFDQQVSAQDDALTASVQRGLRAGVPAQGRFLTTASIWSSTSRGWYSRPFRDSPLTAIYRGLQGS